MLKMSKRYENAFIALRTPSHSNTILFLEAGIFLPAEMAKNTNHSEELPSKPGTVLILNKNTCW